MTLGWVNIFEEATPMRICLLLYLYLRFTVFNKEALESLNVNDHLTTISGKGWGIMTTIINCWNHQSEIYSLFDCKWDRMRQHFNWCIFGICSSVAAIVEWHACSGCCCFFSQHSRYRAQECLCNSSVFYVKQHINSLFYCLKMSGLRSILTGFTY